MTTAPEAHRWEVMGRAIKERRLGQPFTLVELAERAGLSQPFLSQVENGRRNMMRMNPVGLPRPSN